MQSIEKFVGRPRVQIHWVNSEIGVGEQSRNDGVLWSGVDFYFGWFDFYPVRKWKHKHFQIWLYFWRSSLRAGFCLETHRKMSAIETISCGSIAK